MKKVIDLLTQHVSIRKFEDRALPSKIKKELIEAAFGGSTSNFVQATSIIEVDNPRIKSKLADISNSASYVNQSGVFYVFVADLYRQSVLLNQKKQSLAGIQNLEALMVSIVDTAIAGENMAIGAESLDLGICYIGGIRNDLRLVCELLELPPYTVPLFGMTIGYPQKRNAIKPRLPERNKVFKDKYDRDSAINLDRYQKLTENYYNNRIDNPQNTNWTEKMVHFFAEPQREDVAQFIKKQGFHLD